MSASQVDADLSAASHARHIGDAVLFIDTQGAWSVGLRGQTVDQYQSVKVGGKGGVNDDSYEVTAISVHVRSGGGYTMFVQSNADMNVFYDVTLDAQGNVLDARLMSREELYAAEVRYGLDLNGNGGIGGGRVLWQSDDIKLYVDAAGQFEIAAADGSFAPLTYGGAPVTLNLLGYNEMVGVAPKAGGGYRIFLSDPDENVFEFVSDVRGAVGSSVNALSSTALSGVESEVGIDLNRKGDTPLTPGWTTMLKTPALRAEVESQLTNGARIGHAGLLKIMDLAVANGDVVGSDLFNDLQAIAARGQSLFTAKDLSGAETGYLNFVFGQLVNGSKANLFFYGGTAKAQNLGNLSEQSSAAQLRLLSDKWLQGKDLPNPTTEGDTANPGARAATGIYQSFEAPLSVGGFNAADVNQGSAGTCYLLAAIAAIANTNPNALQSVFVANPVGTGGSTWGVRFFDVNGQAHWVTVNNQLVVSSPGEPQASYTKVKGQDAAGKETAELWAPLLEKAYAQANELGIFGRGKDENSMVGIEGGMADPVYSLTGARVTSFKEEEVTINGVPSLKTSLVPEGSTALAEITKALNSGKVVWIASYNQTLDANGAILFTSGHAYMAYDADPQSPANTSVKVYNPWGTSAGPTHVTPFNADLVSLVGTPGYDFWVSV